MPDHEPIEHSEPEIIPEDAEDAAILATLETRETSDDALTNLIKNQDLKKIEALIEKFSKARERIITFPGVEELALQTITQGIIENNSSKMSLYGLFGISDEKMNLARKNAAIIKLRDGDFNRADFLTNIEEIENYKEIAKEGVLSNLRRNHPTEALGIMEKCNLEPAFLRSIEAQEAVKSSLSTLIRVGNFHEAKVLCELTGLPEDIIHSPEMAQARRDHAYFLLNQSLGYGQDVQKALTWLQEEHVNLENPTLQETAILTKITQALIESPSLYQQAALLDQLINAFNLKPEIITAAASQAALNYLKDGKVYAIQLQNKYHLPKNFFTNPEVQALAFAGYSKAVSQARLDDAAVIEEHCNIPLEKCHELIADTITSLLNHGGIISNKVEEITRFYKHEIAEELSLPKVQAAAKKSFSEAINRNELIIAKMIAELFDLPLAKCQAIASRQFADNLEFGKIKSAVALAQDYHLPVDLYTQPELAEAAGHGFTRALTEDRLADAIDIEKLCGISLMDAKWYARHALSTLLSAGQLEQAVEIKQNFEPLIDNLNPSDIPLETLARLKNEPELSDIYERNPWSKGISQLLKLQARASRAEHDPWLTDLKPLVDKLTVGNVLNREESADVELLVEYVKNFGMLNLPLMAELFIDLKRGENFTNLRPEFQQQLIEIIGSKVAKMKGEQIINELRRFKREMQGTLLADKIPQGITTPLGEEAFSAIKGTTQWQRSDSISQVVKTWQAKSTEQVGADLPAKYREQTFDIPSLTQSVASEAAPDNKEKVAAILAKSKGESKTELGKFWEVLEDTQTPFDWTKQRAILATKFGQSPADFELALQKRATQMKTEKGASTAEIEQMIVKEQANFAKKYAELEPLRQRLLALEYPGLTGDNTIDEPAITAFMEELAKYGKLPSLKETLVSVSNEHIKLIDSAWSTRLINAVKQATTNITPENLNAVRDFYVQYLGEHYLNREAASEHTGHSQFSPTLINMLDSAWAKGKDLDKHILTKTNNQLAKLNGSEVHFSGETIPITMVTTDGLMRIYAGDVGDACYTSKHHQLANGGVPNLHAVMFVTNRDTAQERINGSVLFIDTTTPHGEHVLLVRANNPRSNLFNQVVPDALIQATLNYAIETAKQNGFDMVVVPLDGASSACSNRTEVAAYYKKHFTTADKIELTNEDETNFNGYNVWEATGTHPAVAIWRK